MPQHFVPFLRRFLRRSPEWLERPSCCWIASWLLCLMLFLTQTSSKPIATKWCSRLVLSNARRPTIPIKQLQTSGDGPIFRLPGCHEKDRQKHEVILIWGWTLYSFNTKDPPPKSHPSHLRLSQMLWAPSCTLNIWLRSFTPSNKQKQRTNSVLPNYPRHDT